MTINTHRRKKNDACMVAHYCTFDLGRTKVSSTLSFYDMQTTKQKSQIAHNSRLCQDASIIVIGVRPLK
ncbi:MAG: hypothetical protein ACYDBJ_02355 [Aggregatilineales bacterium]